MSTTEVVATRVEAAGFHWWIRPDGDWSSIVEVAVRRAYFTRQLKPEPGDRWLDGGANVGAFSVVAAAAGAEVVAYEPHPESAALARRNLRENGLDVRVHEKALAFAGGTVAQLGLADNPWRSSLLRTKGEQLAVPVVAFDEAAAGCNAVKLDIEGAEHGILFGSTFEGVRKLVFEWHFDWQPPTDVYLAALDRLVDLGFEVAGRKVPPGIDYRWYPPAAVVRCQR